MLNLKKGTPIAKIVGGKDRGKLLFLYKEDDKYMTYQESREYILDHGKLEPRLDVFNRSVCYIAGPSGSGKSTYAVNLIKHYTKFYPNKPFYLFSRTDYHDDPAFSGMRVNQILIDENLLSNPIDITKELTGGSILLFDDCNTIQNEKIKKNIDSLMADIMEVGRKLDITIIITNHLVVPNERKIARTIMNEMQYLTVFPKSGSAHQIKYALKTYFGLDPYQIQLIFKLPSRWVTVSKQYPMYVLYERGCFIL